MQGFLDELPNAFPGGIAAESWWILGAIVLVALVVGWITHRVLPRLARRLVEASDTQWDDAMLEHGVLRQLAHLAPVLVLYLGIDAIPGLADAHVDLVRKGLLLAIVYFVARTLSRFLSACNDMYTNHGGTRRRPIKGYVQLGKLVVYLVALILGVAILIERSPLLLLSGIGALGAVLMLVFKDTILSLVASVQIASNDLLRIGDWIEMPSLGVDGDVVDIALHTVKVQNFDKTIVTIPTHRLIDDSFKNWRGMQDAGARRIKRALNLDQTSVHFLDADERQRLSRFGLLDDHFQRMRERLEEWNAELADSDPVNTHRLTNIGCFRAYVAAYLQANPRIDTDKTLMVRQLAPSATGLPLELYCFAGTTNWSEYEDIQADIFDHLLAILPEFGLSLFQQPTGFDLARLAPSREAPRDEAQQDGRRETPEDPA
ncbi:mechanosensitive ion channel family protein [Luteimonas vadosa]|uniref:Mechanosensitive ion channel family protein n=1 Tax=Luteimonas vadosa TaxID=1165507 RepID=A0ABP9DXP6_9GAMM